MASTAAEERTAAAGTAAMRTVAVARIAAAGIAAVARIAVVGTAVQRAVVAGTVAVRFVVAVAMDTVAAHPTADSQRAGYCCWWRRSQAVWWMERGREFEDLPCRCAACWQRKVVAPREPGSSVAANWGSVNSRCRGLFVPIAQLCCEQAGAPADHERLGRSRKLSPS